MTVTQDEKGRTHLDWELVGVTPAMIDWHWSNLEKSYFLWHPSQHIGFRWVCPPTQERFLGAVHEATQLREDGSCVAPVIRYTDIADMDQEVQSLIVYDHVCIDAGLNLQAEPDASKAPARGYRVHQWKACDTGVIGRSTAITLGVTDIEAERKAGALWAAHAASECANWGGYLPILYKLWQEVPESPAHLKHNLKVIKTEHGLRYQECI